MGNGTHLIFFPETFPYGKGEAFIETEIIYLSKYFDKITIFPFKYGKSRVPRPVPDNVFVMPPLIQGKISHSSLLKPINLNQFRFFISEFFRKKVYLKRVWYKNWLDDTIQTKMLLENKDLQDFLNKAEKLGSAVFYFYWGQWAANMLPFITKLSSNKIVRFHGTDLYEEREVNEGYISFRRQLLDSISVACFVSKHGMNYLRHKYADIDFKSNLHPLGVTECGICPPSFDNILRIVTCSSATPVKRLHIIPDTLKNLPFTVKWTHIGDGPLLHELKRSAETLPTNIEVSFLGYIPNKLVREHYMKHAVDLFINVSSSEGLPVTISEALSTGIPVFATNVGGTGELVDDTIGKLLPANITPRDLANEIEHYFYLPVKVKERLRRKARTRWNEKANAKKNYTDFARFLVSTIENQAQKS